VKLKCAPRARRVGSLIVLNAVVAALAIAGRARAEEPALDEVVVTSQKRAQSIQDVPISVSVLGASALADAGVNDIYDVTREIPTLEVQNSTGSGTVNFRLRRVGNLGNIPTFEPAVGLFVDGAFRSRSFFGSGELLDLDRIEVLNGPQSTLYGKNTTAGVISMFSRAPGSTTRVETEATVGKMDSPSHPLLGGAKVSLSGPLADGWNGSLAGGWSGQNYLLAPSFAGGPEQNAVSRYSVRAQLSHTGESSDLRLIVEQLGDNNRNGSPTATTFVPGSPVAKLHNLLVAQGLAPACTGAEPRDYGNCLFQGVQTNLSATDATLLYDYHFANKLTLSSVTSWDQYQYLGAQQDAMQLGAPVIGYLDQQRGHSIQQELRLTSPGHETVDWLAGAFYYHNDLLRGDPTVPTFYGEKLASAAFWKPILQQLIKAPLLVAAPGQESFVDSNLATNYIGVFGQAVWNVGRFHLNAGLRWQDEKKDATLDQFQNIPAPSLMTLVINSTIPPTDLSRSASKVTYSVTPQVDLGADTMAYATAARGFKSGGYNTGFGRLPASQREFGDETVYDYELGIKTTLLKRRLQLHAALFDTTYDNYQDAAFIGAQFTVGNAQKATDRGAELGLDALLTDTITSNLDVSYADFKYATYTDGVCYPGRTPDGSVTGTCNLSGQHPINAPPLKVSFGIEDRVPVSFGDLFGRLSADWTDRYNTSFSADPRLKQDPYTWMNLRLGADVGHTQITFWMENLLDKRVGNVDALLNLFSNDPSTQTFMQPPRSYGVTLRMKF
jgi:outer membrane receptor protein involved in Fe transport